MSLRKCIDRAVGKHATQVTKSNRASACAEPCDPGSLDDLKVAFVDSGIASGLGSPRRPSFLGSGVLGPVSKCEELAFVSGLDRLLGAFPPAATSKAPILFESKT